MNNYITDFQTIKKPNFTYIELMNLKQKMSHTNISLRLRFLNEI